MRSGSGLVAKIAAERKVLEEFLAFRDHVQS